jgi:hypothetical protein
MNLDELERLEREATAGPWSSTPSDPSQGYECFWITACPEINQEREIATVCGPQNERNTSNAALIAALRNSARELIADARRYREWRRAFREGECGLWNSLCGANSDAEHDASMHPRPHRYP